MTLTVTLALATPKDAEHIASMSRDLIEQGLRWSWTSSRVERHITDRNCSVVVARSDRRLVGFAITRFAEETAHLNLLAVKPEGRRHGRGPRARRGARAAAEGPEPACLRDAGGQLRRVRAGHGGLDDGGLQATVLHKAFRGADFLYTLRLRDGGLVYSLVPSHHNHAIGEKIGIRLELDHLVAFAQNPAAVQTQMQTQVRPHH